MSESSADVKARLRAQIVSLETASSADVHLGCCTQSTPAEVELSVEEEAERAFRKIERLACAREQASVALHRRLVREDFSEAAVERALDRALACGLVDDQRYADVLVRSRLSQGKGRRGIAAELAGLNIDPDSVACFVAEDSNDASEITRALAVLDRKPPRAKNRRDAAYRRLIQKGFGASVATSAARQWCEAHPA